jgi:hypothetical protein
MGLTRVARQLRERPNRLVLIEKAVLDHGPFIRAAVIHEDEFTRASHPANRLAQARMESSILSAS